MMGCLLQTKTNDKNKLKIKTKAMLYFKAAVVRRINSNKNKLKVE